MNILQHSFQQAVGNNKSEVEEMGDQYFDDAKHKLMKDLVDFNSREDFEMYMRGLEKNYYNNLNFPRAPYDVFPDYPPKPFQTLSRKQVKEQQKKDYIERFNEMNTKRLQAYSVSQLPQQNPPPPGNPMLDYLYSVQAPISNLNQTPFFSSIRNNDGGNMYASLKYTPVAQPNSAIPGGPSIGMLGQIMEPPQITAPLQPPFMQRFIAGPSKLETNPLSAPMRSFKNPSPQKQQQQQQLQLNDYNLANPDAQFERYKQLMQYQYYNNNANSNLYNQSAQQQNYYRPPPTFNPPESLVAPNLHFNQQPPPPQPAPKPPVDMSQVYPSDFYNRPNSSIALYNQQVVQQTQPPLPGNVVPGYEKFNPDIYRTLQTNNLVDKALIDSLGGIDDTIKPISDSLKQHELRPFQIQKDYQRELKLSQKGYKPSQNEFKPENLKLVSVSPYRAFVKFDKNKQYQQEDFVVQEKNDDQEEEDSDSQDQDPRGTISGNATDIYNQIKGRNNSPIRSDSEQLREQRANYLKNFNEQKELLSKPFNYQDISGNGQQDGMLPQSKAHQKQYRKMKNHSEYLRSQREGFLNFFSDQRTANMGGDEGFFQQENNYQQIY